MRATALPASPSASPSTSPATPSAIGVEMTLCETKGSDEESDGSATARGSVGGVLQSASIDVSDIEAGNEGSVLVHANPLYPQFQRTGSQGRSLELTGTPSTRAVPDVMQDEALNEEESPQNFSAGENGRARRDTLNPVYNNSAQMVALRSRSNSSGGRAALQQKMNKRFSSEML